MEPANMEAVSTWNTLRELKASCRRSLRLLRRRMENWLNQVEMLLAMLIPVVNFSLGSIGGVSMHAAFTLGASKLL